MSNCFALLCSTYKESGYDEEFVFVDKFESNN